MFGTSIARNRELEALLDQREELEIQISLASDLPRSDAQAVSRKIEKLSLLNRTIDRLWGEL